MKKNVRGARYGATIFGLVLCVPLHAMKPEESPESLATLLSSMRALNIKELEIIQSRLSNETKIVGVYEELFPRIREVLIDTLKKSLDPLETIFKIYGWYLEMQKKINLMAPLAAINGASVVSACAKELIEKVRVYDTSSQKEEKDIKKRALITKIRDDHTDFLSKTTVPPLEAFKAFAESLT